MTAPLIAANWKMNTRLEEGILLAQNISARAAQYKSVEVLLCPPFTHLTALSSVIMDSPLKLGAQNCHDENSGAFTGEISAVMLKSVGCDYVILGHSERRILFKESSVLVNRKIRAALSNGLRPILCVGETLEQREAGKTLDVVGEQCRVSLSGIESGELKNLEIAYEPVWAIGTGKTASPKQAQDVHAAIRKLLAEQVGKAIAGNIRLLYGGSVKADNAADLLGQPDINGALVGGASLNEDSFDGILKAAMKS